MDENEKKDPWNIYWSQTMKYNNLKYNILKIGTKVVIPHLFGKNDMFGTIIKIMLPGYSYSNTQAAELRYQVNVNKNRDIVVSFNDLYPANNPNFKHLIKDDKN
jgi:hypothetical protein